MPKKTEEFVPSVGKQPVYRMFKPFMRLLFRKPKKVINLLGEHPKKSIVVINHSAKSGPPALDLYYPIKTYKWGAYQMLGDYKMRVAYLRDILYIKKLGKKPGFATSFKSRFMALFNVYIYRGMKVLPTYPDARFAHTLRDSVKVLDANIPVMIYPENSNEGYKDVLTEFFPGFVMLAEKYYKATGEDVPVIPAYYSLKKRIMVIGKAMYVQDFVKQGMDRYQIAEEFCKAVNQLYFDYVQNA